MARARAGDPLAERIIFREHAPQLARVVVGLMGGTAETADIVQETFVTAFRKLDTLEDPAGLKAWLTGIAIRKASNARRAHRRRWWQVLFAAETMPTVPVVSVSVEDRELLTAADRVLARMEEDLRVVFVLRFVEEMDLTEVAEATGVSLATVKRRLGAARASFTELAAHDPALSGRLAGEP